VNILVCLAASAADCTCPYAHPALLYSQDQVVNLLVRLALLLLSAPEAGGGQRDEDTSLQQQYALGLLAQAATVWPYCNIKVRASMPCMHGTASVRGLGLALAL